MGFLSLSRFTQLSRKPFIGFLFFAEPALLSGRIAELLLDDKLKLEEEFGE